MEVLRSIELTRIGELKILNNVRLIHGHDLNGVYSKDNLRVQFQITGDLLGSITGYLCLDGQELSATEKNYIFPLFTEAMNILVGRQISLDDEMAHLNLKLSSPKISMLPLEINTAKRISTQQYLLEMDGRSLTILVEYNLTAIN